MSVLGNRVLRREDPKFLTVGGTYTADVRDPLLDGAAYVTYVRASMAHAKIDSIDTSEAAALPGVLAIYTAADLGLEPTPASPFFPQYSRTLLASDTVRYVGEPIAAVLSERPEQGEDAAEAVIVDYDPLPAVVDVEDAASDATLLYPAAGTNVCHDSAQWGVPELSPAEEFFAGCDVVVRQRTVNQRVAAAPLEVRSAAAAWTPDGRVHQWISTQHPQGARDAIAAQLGEGASVRVVAPDVGGGFGAKIGVYPEEILLAQLAKRAGRPVRWLETRTENMLALGHGRGQRQDIEIGGTRDGKVLAYRLTVLQDAGAAPNMGAILPTAMTKPMAAGVYAIPKIEFKARAVLTNTCPTVAYRGAGRPEATAAVERAMDLFAAEIGMDPVEVRRINLIPPFAEPYTTSAGSTYDNGDYAGCLDAALAAAGYEELRAEQAQRRANGDTMQLGIGVSIYVEITGAGAPPLSETARVVVADDGSATVYSGTSSHGQGHQTAWAMIASSELGIPLDQITVIQNDTDLIPVGGGTMGSRSLQQGGAAVLHTSQLVAEQAKQHAADVLEAAPADVVLDVERGVFHVSGTPAKTASWAEVAVAARAAGTPIDIDEAWSAPSATYPFGAHVAVVEVDTETGRTRLIRHVACDDAGRILNPLLVDGQVHGGIAQGAAQALYEGVRYDEDGNPITSNFADYAFPSAAELPSYERIPHETPTPVNPLGAKGIGESGTIGSTPAIQSAVADALGHLGVRHVEMPATPETVWAAIQAAQL
jgi:carbon-monoxide dehydrogenase large subunit